ncbi:SDR family NAD(P)-dependent oxidoreductase [Calothrix sp. 336/3]|uniref:SDR family NAD(P)-dependent oxidoreductase n=1 Tax=Calothrix sp. 336/3 TaxID=1337936 RepID=UPI0004E3F081|nr:SDR family oxidoreductase [Calothrix sp. 336/3]AKG24606.1 short-chain dehydrogenase [Calothrix sp. 336/3]
MNPTKNIQQTVLVTGAASGIGYELAYFFAHDGYNLILVDKNGAELPRIADDFQLKFGIKVKTIVKDLSISTSPTEIFTELQQESIRVDILVNNAGFGNHGLFANTDLTTELKMLQVNIVAITHLTKLFVREMVKNGYGKILNVASTAAFQPGPLMAVYFASKAYILSFSEAIANELEGTGVSVTVLCPGPTESPFHQTTGMADTSLVKGKKMMTAKTVAEAGYHSLMRNKTVIVPGLKNKILAEFARVAPRKLVAKIVRSMQEVR